MEKANDYKVTVYNTGIEDFMVDIVEDEVLFEAWLYRKNSGIKSHMFGASKLQKSFVYTMVMFIETVEANLPDYCRFYDEEMDDIEDMHNRKMEEKDEV